MARVCSRSSSTVRTTTAVQELLVDLDGRRREEDHHRAAHPVLLGHEPPARRVLARRGDRQLALALQELESVGRPLGPLLLDDRQDLVLEVRLAHVEEALPGHGRVLDPLLLGDEGERRPP